MGLYDISSAELTNLSNSFASDGIIAQDTEIGRYVPDWAKWHGKYRRVGRLQAIIDKVAVWSAGKGIKAIEKNKQSAIDSIRGFGKDTARDICINQIRTSDIVGDSFAEILWLDNRKSKLNLKPLAPGTIEILTNNKGILIGYNQIVGKTGADGRTEITRVPNADGKLPTWKPEEIFHLPRMRIADECHGIGVIERIENIILMKEKTMETMQIIIDRCAKPLIFIEADTDDRIKLMELKTQYEDMIKKGEAIVAPKDTIKLMELASKSNIEILPWLTYLDKEFLIAEGVPEVILGAISSKDTESASKIVFVAWNQVVKDKQNWFEEQWKAQIGFEIDLPEPPSIEEMLKSTIKKEGQGNKVTDISATGENK